MNAPAILKGIVFAILASLSAGFLSSVFSLLFDTYTSNSLIILLLSTAYLLFLLKQAQSRQGRVVIITIWIGLSLGGLLLGISLMAQILLQLLTIWLLRSLYFHASILAALLDLLLIILASGAAVWTVLQTGSWMAAVWSFFLCQSLFGFIPKFSAGNKNHNSDRSNDHFEAAHRVAQEAVRKLSIN